MACTIKPEATCLQFVEPNRQLFAPGLTGNVIPMHDLECRYIDKVRNLNNETVEMQMIKAVRECLPRNNIGVFLLFLFLSAVMYIKHVEEPL
jgi:hypothetical protein